MRVLEGVRSSRSRHSTAFESRGSCAPEKDPWLRWPRQPASSLPALCRVRFPTPRCVGGRRIPVHGCGVQAADAAIETYPTRRLLPPGAPDTSATRSRTTSASSGSPLPRCSGKPVHRECATAAPVCGCPGRVQPPTPRARPYPPTVRHPAGRRSGLVVRTCSSAWRIPPAQFAAAGSL